MKVIGFDEHELRLQAEDFDEAVWLTRHFKVEKKGFEVTGKIPVNGTKPTAPLPPKADTPRPSPPRIDWTDPPLRGPKKHRQHPLVEELDIVFEAQIDGRRFARHPDSGKAVLIHRDEAHKVLDGENWRVRLEHRNTYCVAFPIKHLDEPPVPRPVAPPPPPEPILVPQITGTTMDRPADLPHEITTPPKKERPKPKFDPNTCIEPNCGRRLYPQGDGSYAHRPEDQEHHDEQVRIYREAMA